MIPSQTKVAPNELWNQSLIFKYEHISYINCITFVRYLHKRLGYPFWQVPTIPVFLYCQLIIMRLSQASSFGTIDTARPGECRKNTTLQSLIGLFMKA